jgi:hypothetical protein
LCLPLNPRIAGSNPAEKHGCASQSMQTSTGRYEPLVLAVLSLKKLMLHSPALSDTPAATEQVTKHASGPEERIAANFAPSRSHTVRCIVSVLLSPHTGLLECASAFPMTMLEGLCRAHQHCIPQRACVVLCRHFLWS